METGEETAVRSAATTYPDGERYVLALVCPADGCNGRLWIGASQMRRPSEHRATGKCAWPQCGRHLYAALTGDGRLLVEQ